MINTNKKSDYELTTTPEENTRYIRYALDGWNSSAIDISDPKQVEERIIEYFESCGVNNMRPCVSGLCNRLGIHKNTFLAWCNGRERSETHQQLAIRARGFIEEITETLMLNNKINVVAAIFLLKNHFGYTDRQDIAIAPSNTVTNPVSMDEIMELCDDSPIEVDFEEVNEENS